MTDNKGKPISDVNVTVKDDMGGVETGDSDGAGVLILPILVIEETHTAYIKGYVDGTFGPERQMTRSGAAAIFARLLATKNDDTIQVNADTKFDDIPANAWYSGYVRYLTNYRIIYSRGNNQFAPNASIARAEVVTITNRVLDWNADGDYVDENRRDFNSFNDVSWSHWADYAVMESVNTHDTTLNQGETWAAAASISAVSIDFHMP